MYNASEMRELSRWIDEIAALPDVKGRQMAYYEDSRLAGGGKILSRIEYFADFHDSMRGLIYGPKMMSAVHSLLGEPGVLFKEKINFKLPGGGGFEPHQDIQPGWDDYAPYFLSVLVTVDESTVENGCLELAAGHHTRGLIGQKWKPLQGPELEGMTFKPYPMSPGDVAFFDCFVPHRSDANLTQQQRRNLYLTYNRQSDGDHRRKYFADKRKSYPPDFEREPGKEYVFRV
jgi:ectoine hydroxylase-related dioxygenase (phytanoyl-CoA dioxygenase family)